MAEEATTLCGIAAAEFPGCSELIPQSTGAGLGLQILCNTLTSRQTTATTNTEGNSEVAADSESSQCIITPDMKEALEVLENKGRVVLCGLPGTGKTIIGHAFLRRSRKEGFTPYILSEVKEWNVLVGKDKKSFVLMDGTLGERFMDKQQYQVWRSILRTVLELTDQGCCRLVLTLYPHVLRELQEVETNRESPILDKDALLHLMEHTLEENTKEDLLWFHAAKLNLDPSQISGLIESVLQNDASGPAFMWCCHHMVEQWQSCPDPAAIFTSPAETYMSLLKRWLVDCEDGSEAVAAVLALTMKGIGSFHHNSSQAKSTLHHLNFAPLSMDRLTEVAFMLEGSFLSEDGDGFTNRVMYDATGLGLGRFCRIRTVLKVCDVTFLLQHVRTFLLQSDVSHDAKPRLYVTVDSVSEGSERKRGKPEDYQCLVERLYNEIVDGQQLTQIAQHPSLQCPEFLAALEKYCKTDKRFVQRLVRAVDSHHKLPLMYWSIYLPSLNLTRWCLQMMTEAKTDLSVLPKVLIAHAILYQNSQHLETAEQSLSICSLVPNNFKGFTGTTTIWLPKFEDCLTKETQQLRAGLAVYESTQHSLYYLRDPTLPMPSSVVSLKVAGDKLNVKVCNKREWYLVLRLLADQQTDEQDTNGNTLLHIAAETGNLDTIKLAVKSGASVTVRNNNGFAPYHVAQQKKREGQEKVVKVGSVHAMFSAICDSDLESVKIFLCNGYDVDCKDSSGNTALLVACGCGQENIASIFVDLGADVNAKNNINKTPLLAACEAGDTQTATCLIQHKADVNAKDGWNKTPLHTVCIKGDTQTALCLIKHKADVNANDGQNSTPLHEACRAGHAQTALCLIENKSIVNARNNWNDTPLHVACRKGHTQTFQCLIQNSADVNAKDGLKNTPLHIVCTKGDTWAALFLIEHSADVNVRDGQNSTPLHTACLAGHNQIAQCLIKHKADVNAGNSQNITPLHITCCMGDTQIVLCLLQHKADVNAKNDYDATPLHDACRKGHTQIALCLLQYKADVNAQNDHNNTPLHVACEEDHGQTALCLIQNKADVNARNDCNATPLHIACGKGHTSTALCLMQHKADVNAKDGWNKTPLHIVCAKGDTQTALCLMENKANVNARNDSNNTPLHVACRNGHAETAQCLLKHKAVVNTNNDCNTTPLHDACREGHTQTVLCLLQHEADVNAKNGHNVTPLHDACRKGHTQIALCLLQHKADVNTKDDCENTPLHIACKEGHTQTALCLLEHEADFKTNNIYNETPLQIAIKSGHTEIVRVLSFHMW